MIKHVQIFEAFWSLAASYLSLRNPMLTLGAPTEMESLLMTSKHDSASIQAGKALVKTFSAALTHSETSENLHSTQGCLSYPSVSTPGGN